MGTILQEAIRVGIKTAPEAAMREIPQILDLYINDVKRLNLVYLAAKRLCLQDDQFARELLRRAVAEAERGL